MMTGFPTIWAALAAAWALMQPVAEPVTGPVTGPVAEPVTEPVTGPVTGPVYEQIPVPGSVASVEVVDGEAEGPGVDGPGIETADELLDALEASNAGLRGASVKQFRLTVLSDLDMELFQRVGTLAYDAGLAPGRAEDGGADGGVERERSPRFALRFTHRLLGRRVEEDVEVHVFDGVYRVEQHPGEGLFIRERMSPPGEALAIARAGLPFWVPFGHKKADVLAQFEVELVASNDGLTAGRVRPELKDVLAQLEERVRGCYQLRLVPRAGVREELDTAEVRLWYDGSTLLPVAAKTIDLDFDEKVVDLRGVELNAEFAEGEFDVSLPGAEDGVWTTVEDRPWRGA